MPRVKITDDARVHRYFSGLADVLRRSPSEYDDIVRIRQMIPELSCESLRDIRTAWEDYSDHYCATWLIVSEDQIREFRRWLGLD